MYNAYAHSTEQYIHLPCELYSCYVTKNLNLQQLQTKNKGKTKQDE